MSVADLNFRKNSVVVTCDADGLVDLVMYSLLLLFLAFDADLAEVVESVAEIADLSASWTRFVSEPV